MAWPIADTISCKITVPPYVRDSPINARRVRLSTPPVPDRSVGRPSLLGARQQGGEARSDAGPQSMLSAIESPRKAQGKARQRATDHEGKQRQPASTRPSASTDQLPASPGSNTKWLFIGLGMAVLAVGGTYVMFLQEHGAASSQLSSTAAVNLANVASAAGRSVAHIESMPKVASLPLPTVPDSPFKQLDPSKPQAAVAATSTASSAAPVIKSLAPFESLNRPSPPKASNAVSATAVSKSVSSSGPEIQGDGLVAVAGGMSTKLSGAATQPAAEPAVAPLVSPPLAAAAVQPNLTPAQRRKAARDADVALLTAMIEHVSANSRQEVNGSMAPLRLPGSRGQPMTTIAQIVEHCRSLAGEEAKVCKVRICENYWGKDDACSTRPDFHRPEPH